MSFEARPRIQPQTSVQPQTSMQPQTSEELRTCLEAYCYFKDHGFGEATEGAEPNTWDVRLVTDMSELFSGLETFNAPIDRWDTSNVTNMEGMFRGATAFNQPLTIDTSNDEYEVHV